MVEGNRIQKIVYLLHRFPRQTDTFIMREILALERLGVDIHVLAIWPPGSSETSSETRDEWSSRVTFLIGKKKTLSIAAQLVGTIFLSPVRFISTALLAWKTSRDGLRGFLNQLFYLAEAILAARMLQSGGFTHIHNHFGDHSGTVTMLAAHFCNLPFSLSFHGPHVFFDSPNVGMKEKVQRAKFCRCISYYCRSQLMFLSGFSDLTRLPIVRCGIEPTMYKFRAREGTAKIMFCASRLAPEKGLEFLLEAMRLLNVKGHRLTLRLAGSGPSCESLKRISEDLGLAHQIRFLGNLNEQEIAAELSQADLFVLPSLAEGVPVSIMEAMASGALAVVTNVAGVSELIDDDITGLLVRATDSMQLAHKIESIVSNPSVRNQIAARARNYVEVNFDITKEAQTLKILFKRNPQ